MGFQNCFMCSDLHLGGRRAGTLVFGRLAEKHQMAAGETADGLLAAQDRRTAGLDLIVYQD